MAETATGVLLLTRNGNGVLLDPGRSFRRGMGEIRVPAKLVKRHGLSQGMSVCGPVQKNRREADLISVDSVCGRPPQDARRRTRFKELVAVDPYERFELGVTGDPSMRIIDLVAPVGKGTRGLIVSPPKAGKTMILEKMAQAIRVGDPETRIIVLLIDERPEEVTMFRRAVDAEVLASSSDQSVPEHVALAELALAHIRTELEFGRDVVVLVDSLTRMSRAFNSRSSGTGRTLSGGVDAGALRIPRSFFGMARKVENGGSVTIVATVLIDTGSRMDQVIFEEFKGTGNSEIVLDAKLAQNRIFPAISLPKSGTRKDERLYTPDEFRRVVALRKALAGRRPREAVELLHRFLEKYPTNEEFLRSDFVVD